MVDEPPKPRKRGRPPKPVEEITRRPTVGLRLRQEIYDQVVDAAKKNGRSLSEEMEVRVTEAFSQTQPEALSKAEAAARAALDEEYVEFFGGRNLMMIAFSEGELFKDALASTYAEWNSNEPDAVTDAFVATLLEKVIAGQQKIINEWYDRVKLGRALQTVNLDQFFDDMKALLDTPRGQPLKKILLDKIEGANRRREKTAEEGGDDGQA